MRIISKFNDYYDGAMGYGIDKTVIYNRSSAEFPAGSAEWAKIEKYLDSFKGGMHTGLLSLHSWLNSVDNLEVRNRFVLFFCGKPHVGICLSSNYNKRGNWEVKERYCYSLEHAERFISEHEKRIRLEGKEIKALLKKIDRFFERYGAPKVSDFNDLHFSLDCPIIKVDSNIRKASLVTNPCLKDMEFYCVTDPFTAFQELSMYISGVMGGRSPRTVEIGNDDRIAKHGFNKWSFRRESCRKRK